ncbi:MAG: DUF3617 domain-containing protein [Myxococcales bacterium]|nr:DUF3617 domain-containing protein [Myxococcales bacterium]MCB9649721.1 DUF3617 domain-containing protein [Deltaproteobacteria bacterium]
MKHLLITVCLTGVLGCSNQAAPSKEAEAPVAERPEPVPAAAITSTSSVARLAVKAGVWETTTEIELKRAKAPSNLEQLTPQQRHIVEQKLAAQVKRETRTDVRCLTEAKIASGEAFTGNSHLGACAPRIEVRTPEKLVAKLECTGANALTGTVEMRAVDAEHMTGTVEMTYGRPDGLQMVNRSQLTSRWLRAECDAAAVHAQH